MKRIFLLNILIFVSIVSFSCNKKNEEEIQIIEREETVIENLTYPNKVDMSKWLYNSDDNVYYQLGIDYCVNPVDEKYEKLAIFVNDKFMDGVNNGDGTYTCKVSNEKVVKNYIAMTAPIVMPIEKDDFSANEALTEYSSNSKIYTDEGFIYVHAGHRGKEHGAPLGVVDIKAAIRYIKYNSDLLLGDSSKIFTFGMGSGGAKSMIVGATGDSPLYEKYLDNIGAVKNISDSVFGAAAWCPIINFDSADMEYEWNMGESRKDISDYEKDLSKKLSKEYVKYINSLNLYDSYGNSLSLEDDGNMGHKGSYYELVKSLIEDSLNDFLINTTFPYTYSGQVYETKEDYINDLNKDFEWVFYDEKMGSAKISNISDFSKAVKIANKNIPAFDALDKTYGENILFGIGDGNGVHFDSYMSEIVEDEKKEEYINDLNKVDSLGYDTKKRVNMYSPLYFLLKNKEGYNTVNVAEYFRIRSGISQSETSVTTEINLAMALSEHRDVKGVDFEMVWGKKHEKAESIGDSDINFIEWVNRCMGIN